MSKKGEIGRIGQLRYGSPGYGSILYEDFLPELRGTKGVHAYTEMADNDAIVGGVLFAVEMLMRNVDFKVEASGNTEKDKEAAEFVESCMHDMERTWADTFSEILSFLTYGWSYHEIVYKRRVGKTSSPITNSKYADGLIGWRKLPIRAQDTLYGWEYKEGTDDLIGMTQMPAPDYEKVTIPLEKALHFRTRSKKDNPEGRSVLRTAYRAYYFKKRLEEIEGYGMERDLAGFPVLYGPAGVDLWDTDNEEMVRALAQAEQIVSSIRRDAMEGLVLPGGYEAGTGWKLELLASSGKRQFDTNAIIDRYDKRIATSVLADFIMLGQEQVGSFALADTKTKIFGLAIGAYLDVICEVFNNQGIPRLIDINGDHFKGITDYPKMTHGDIDERDLTQFATYMEKMVAIGVIIPDDELEKEARRIGHLPEKLETEIPGEVQPGENGLQEADMARMAGGRQGNGRMPGNGSDDGSVEGKTIYKVTSILDKYQSGRITRRTAEQLFMDIGIDEEKIAFYLDEADLGRKQREKEESEKDAKDAKVAEEAKKSLRRKLDKDDNK